MTPSLCAQELFGVQVSLPFGEEPACALKGSECFTILHNMSTIQLNETSLEFLEHGEGVQCLALNWDMIVSPWDTQSCTLAVSYLCY